MKKYSITVMAFLFICLGAIAQEEPDTPEETTQDTLKVQLGGKSIAIIDEGSADKFEDEDDDYEHSELTYWGGIDLGVNMLRNSDNSLDRTDEDAWLENDLSKSLSVGVNLFEGKIKLIKNYVGITTGLGLVYNSYGLADTVNIVSRVPNMNGDLMDSTFYNNTGDLRYSKNKLRTTHLRVPVLLEFNTSENEDRNFHIAAGVQGGWRIGAINKVKYESNDSGDEVKVRRKNNFNTNDFSLDATARVGYRDWTFFATYGLTSLFEEGKGPEVYPVSFGLSVIPW